MTINPTNVIRILEEEFRSHSASPLSERDREFASYLSGVINTHLTSVVDFEENCELIFENPMHMEMETDSSKCSEEVADGYVEYDDDSEQLLSGQGSSSSSWHDSPLEVKRNKRDDIPFSKRKRAVDFWREVKTKNGRDISTVQNRFKYVESKRQLYLWETQIQQNGVRHEKLVNIATAVRSRFVEARLMKKSIHDVDLRRWALLEARKEEFPFKASRTWLLHFKKINKIKSRKVTKFVSRGAVAQQERITESVLEFVKTVRDDFKSYSLDEIYNTDQSGFNLEMHAGRTLAQIGDKHVEATVQSVSATTHSDTIMPTVTASGQLLSPLVIVFKEPDGKFGKTVEHTIFKARNVLPIAAKSSIMGKVEIGKWFQDAFLPNVGEKALLLVDSLNAYNNAKKSLSPSLNVKIRTIPAHTTGILQPLDVYFFRQWKSFSRKISEYVLLENIDFSLRVRNNIIKLQSLIHNQFCAPRFLNFRKYAWYKSGYIEEKAPAFVNPIEFCFMSDEMICSECNDVKLLKCGWCEKPLCIKHAIVELHYHNN